MGGATACSVWSCRLLRFMPELIILVKAQLFHHRAFGSSDSGFFCAQAIAAAMRSVVFTLALLIMLVYAPWRLSLSSFASCTFQHLPALNGSKPEVPSFWNEQAVSTRALRQAARFADRNMPDPVGGPALQYFMRRSPSPSRSRCWEQMLAGSISRTSSCPCRATAAAKSRVQYEHCGHNCS